MQKVVPRLALLFFFSTILCKLPAQVLEQWSQRYNGPANAIDLLTTMVVDNQGNIYVAGRSTGVDTNQDFCIVKYSSSGDEELVLRFDGEQSSWDEIYDLAVDVSGNIYATGMSHYSAMTIKYAEDGTLLWNIEQDSACGECIRVDESGSIYVGYNKTTGLGLEILINKYSTAGLTLWSTTIQQNSLYGAELVDLQVDQIGNVYITGEAHNQEWEDGLVFSDIITVKLGPGGNELWRKLFSASAESDDNPFKLQIDKQGNIIIGAMAENNTAGYIIVKYSENGDSLWTRIFNGPYGTDYATDCTVDADDNIIITGYSYQAEENFNILTIKYDSAGNELWTMQYNGPGNTRDFAASLISDPLNNIYITGSSRHGMIGTDTCVTIKYDKDGHMLWAESYSDSLEKSCHGKHIAYDTYGDIIVAAGSVGINSGWDYLTIKYDQYTLGILNDPHSRDRFTIQNYPNPFNPITTITYHLIAETDVSVIICNLRGEQIIRLLNDRQSAGVYKVQWDGRDRNGKLAPSGVYICMLKTETQVRSRKILFLH